MRIKIGGKYTGIRLIIADLNDSNCYRIDLRVFNAVREYYTRTVDRVKVKSLLKNVTEITGNKGLDHGHKALSDPKLNRRMIKVPLYTTKFHLL